MTANSKDLKKLQKVWYKKLKKSGFEDIEKDENTLKHWATRVFKESSNGSYYNEKEVYYKSREEYYRMAGRFLWDFTFDNKLEHKIWSLHSEGMSIRDIGALIRKTDKKVYDFKVQMILKKLSTLMLQANGIKK